MLYMNVKLPQRIPGYRHVMFNDDDKNIPCFIEKSRIIF